MFDKYDILCKKFGRLTIISYSHCVDKYSKKGHSFIHYYTCLCDCGKYCVVERNSVREGHTLSCGCLNKDFCKKQFSKHRLTKDPLYKIYYRIIRRCYDKKDVSYKNYGQRGIVVCSLWKEDFYNFYNWAINNGYKKGLSIDRIDNNYGYSPDNCRWATAKEQSNNKRNNIIVEWKGEQHTLKQWAEILNVNYKKLWERTQKRGWSFEKAITK